MEEKFISLFEYLGHAGGKELGKELGAYAKMRKSKYGIKQVSNTLYTGPIFTYPKMIIDEFFAAKQIFKNTKKEVPVEDASLPF